MIRPFLSSQITIGGRSDACCPFGAEILPPVAGEHQIIHAPGLHPPVTGGLAG